MTAINLLLPAFFIALPYIFFAMAVVIHIYYGEAESKTTRIILGTLRFGCGAVAVYLFLFSPFNAEPEGCITTFHGFFCH